MLKMFAGRTVSLLPLNDLVSEWERLLAEGEITVRLHARGWKSMAGCVRLSVAVMFRVSFNSCSSVVLSCV